jgi:hypothetical protein
MSVPRAASFAVSLKVGRPKSQPALNCDAEQIIDDIVENLSLLNDNKEQALRQRIGQEPYLRNFIGLARMLAPSGDDVNFVGLTFLQKGQERRLKLTRTGSEMQFPGSGSRINGKRIRVTGKLLFADSIHGKDRIKLVDSSKKEHSIVVPEGMMADIVRPLWDSIVSVEGTLAGKELQLERIEKGGDDKP